MDDLLKSLGRAIHDLFSTGGRLSDESFEFIEKLLNDEFKDLKKELVELVQGTVSALTEKIEELEGRLKAVSTTAAKKVSPKS